MSIGVMVEVITELIAWIRQDYDSAEQRCRRLEKENNPCQPNRTRRWPVK